MTRGQRIPADQVVLSPGDTVYWHDDPHWEGRIDKFVSPDHQWIAVSYYWAEGGDNRCHVSNYTTDAPAPPRRARQNGQLSKTANAPQWQQDLLRLAEQQVRLPEPRRFRRQGLAGTLILLAVIAAVANQPAMVAILVVIVCLMPMQKGPRG